jgi:L-fucose isomerase-like protein
VRRNGAPDIALDRMARFGVMMDRWMSDSKLDATAIQCWTAMEEYFGATPCTVMSMLSNALLPSACETDVAGALAMHVLVQASGQPSALVDWNNNYEDDPDKAVLFHCSNLPAQVLDEIPLLEFNPGLAERYGKDNTFGLLMGRVKASPFTYLRLSTNDMTGQILAYVGEGELTDDPLQTYGGYGVARIPRLQELLQHICKQGFEHHVAINQSLAAGAVYEALTTYKGWGTYYHR